MLVGVVTIPTGTASAATTLTTTVNGSSVSLTYDGEGTSASPYQIDSLAKLQGMRADLSAHYQLVQDIDASATQGWNGGAGFDPVGDAGTAFTGNFDGKNHTISDLVIDRPTSNQIGLFGYVGGGVIDNVDIHAAEVAGRGIVAGLVGHNAGTVTNSSYTGNVSGTIAEVGGLVGHNAGIITDTYASGAVTGNSAVGGLVGRSSGTVNNSSATGNVSGTGEAVGGLVGRNSALIGFSHATGNVTGSDTMVGGLVGRNAGGGSINDSYATGGFAADSEASGGLVGENDGGAIFRSYATGDFLGNDSYKQVGGLVGLQENGGSINDSYATGEITGDRYMGGLVAFNKGQITDSYAIGTVGGRADKGGLVGTNDAANGGTITTSYWDVETTGQTTSAGSPDTDGLSSGEMTGNDAFGSLVGFDATTVWQANPSTPAMFKYPTLQANAQDPPPQLETGFVVAGGDGTGTNPYQITTWKHLDSARFALDANFSLSNDLDTSIADYAGVASATADSDSGFDPIGSASTPFSGSFDGGNQTISDLVIDRGTEDDVGLFGFLDGGIVQHLGLVNLDITGSGAVGGLAGQANDSTITNSYATGGVGGAGADVGGLVGDLRGTIADSYATTSVTGSSGDVGGLVGDSEGTITNSYASGSISGVDSVGGLVGRNDAGTVDVSNASGVVTATGDVVGGLVANNTGTITDSNATGAVTAASSAAVGGLVGDNQGTIARSHATGAISGNAFVGGLVGNVTAGSIVDSLTSGAVSGGDRVGGFAGLLSAGSISNASATGAVSGSGYVGGLLGDSRSTLDNSSASGDVTASGDRAGGLVGDNRGTIVDSSASGATSGVNTVGGLVGHDRGTGINRSHATGAISATGSVVGGLVGNATTGPITDSYATGTVDGSGTIVGGLVGRNAGATITNGTASGAVDGTGGYVGGLVGENQHTITASTATGAVTGGGYLGGLVGDNQGGTVSNSSATGTVAGATATTNVVGGLVGVNRLSSTVTGTYANGSVTGNDDVGGLVGMNYAGSVNESYASGNVTGSGAHVGGLVGWNRLAGATIDESFATGVVTGTTDVGGLVGLNAGTVTDGYWDTNSSGIATAADGVGLTTTEMQRSGPSTTMSNFSFESPATWVITTSYPALAWQGGTALAVITLEAQSTTTGTGESGTLTVSMTEDGVAAGAGTSIEVRSDAGLDGFATGDTKSTDGGGTVAFSFTESEVGSYAPVFAIVTDPTITATASVTVEAPAQRTRSSGSSTTTSVAISAGTTDSDTESDEEVPAITSIVISEARGGDPIRIELAGLTTEGSSLSPGSIDVTFTDSGDHTFDISTREVDIDPARAADDPADDRQQLALDLSADALDAEARAFVEATGQRPGSFLEVDTTAETSAAVETATFSFRVSNDYIAATGGSVESVGLYRLEADGWRLLPTSQNGTDEQHSHFEAVSPGFSTFAIAADSPVFEHGTARLDSFDETTGVVMAAMPVQNHGSAPATVELALTAGEVVLDSQLVTVEPGETTTTTFTGVVRTAYPTPLRLGDQSLGAVEREAAAPDPDEAPASPGVAGVGLSLAVVLASALLLFVLRRRERQFA